MKFNLHLLKTFLKIVVSIAQETHETTSISKKKKDITRINLLFNVM
jgi:hypothetical protein